MEIMNFILTHKYALLTLLGAGLVAFSAFKGSIDQKKTEDEFKEANIKIQKQNEKIQQLSALTIKLQDETIKELAHQTNSLTGGNTFPIVSLTYKSNNTPHIFVPTLTASGKYPLFNFSFRLRVINGPSNMKGFKFDIQNSNK